MNVVITGTSSGLGAALYRRFVGVRKHWVRVMGSTHDPALVNSGQMFLDLRHWNSIHNFVTEVAATLRSVDVLINNAGTNGIKPFEIVSEAFLHEMMQVNCIGSVMLTQRLLPTMKPGSTIINVVSEAAWKPMRHSLGYNISKAAMLMATKQMARELTKPYKISVIAVNPGKMVGTGMSEYIDRQVCELRGWTKEEALTYAANASVTGYEVNPALIADHIYQIVTGGLAPYLSGASIDLVG